MKKKKATTLMSPKDRIVQKLTELTALQNGLDPLDDAEIFMEIQFEMKGLAYALGCLHYIKLDEPEYKCVKRSYQIIKGGKAKCKLQT